MKHGLSRLSAAAVACVALCTAAVQSVHAQISTVVFQDDFSANTIDPAKYQADAPFFEGGTGDIHAEAGNGVMKFVGTTTAQWWSGGTLRVVPTFEASDSTPVKISIDRVAEVGVGSASRSALWILDETKTKYVLFADVRGEGGWHYNRKIGEDGDVPTGGGNNIAVFDGAAFDDGGNHRMSLLADGKTVKLMLDGHVGAEVKFPFTKIQFQFGSYARANNDTADTTWDNLKIETNLKTAVVFSDDFSSNTVNPAKFQPDAPFFEGGTGDIHAEASGGVMKFVGATTQQWWSGGTLRALPIFDASEATPVAVSVDRVAEVGVGSASRSALWILDETKTKYVLFADVRNEGGWRYNRKIGENGDVPTGSGTDIGLFNGASYDDGGIHKMQIIADGKTVKLVLDGQVGTEVKFPFSKVQFQFGSYARANNDTADTTWDNFKVETVLKATSVVFQDDFSANTIDPAKYQADAPFFEGGVGDIHAQADGGVMKFVGTTTTQWWSGGTLGIVPQFAPSEAEKITISIDRVAEAGVGSASRSALWILDATKTKYVLFADVRGEGGWHYNRKIGQAGDVPTGGGNNIALFDGAAFDDGGLHRMSMVADGKTVKLLLDGVQGAEVNFPFSPVVFQFGSYARANNDTADTTWDNLKIETAGGATFLQTASSVRVGANSPEITVRIPAGLNSQNAVHLKVVSSDPSIAIPVGGTGGSLDLTFPAGGANTLTFRTRGVALGGAQFTLEGDFPGANKLGVAVISGPGIALDDPFTGNTLDAAKWQKSTQGFETTGVGTFDVSQTGGTLVVSGTTDTSFWAGAGVKSTKSFVATKELNLVFDVDRVSLDQSGSAGRTGVYLTTADRSKFVFFGQNVGENNWEVNINPGNPTGSGTTLAVFSAKTETGKNRIRLVADGSTVEVFLDDVSGGRFPFEVSSGIFFELGAYARAETDTVTGVFDNAKVQYVLPCTSVTPAGVSMTTAESGKTVTITVPQLLNDAAPVTVTVASLNPNVAVPAGAVNGSLTLTFAAGAANSQVITVVPVGKGATQFSIVSSPANCVVGNLDVEVVVVPKVLLTDNFSGNSVDTTKWRVDTTSFDSGTATPESELTLVNGAVKISVTAETSLWPGIALFTANSFDAAATAPLTFEVDRTLVEYQLTTGTGAEERSGVWVRDGAGNFVFLSDYIAHDGRNFGWRYNKATGQADDNPTNEGTNLGAFDGGNFDDEKSHHVKLVANGSTVKFYVDGVLGGSVPFPFSQGLSFGFGAYVDETGNVVRGYFDNAVLSGGEDTTVVPSKLSASLQGANVVISWTGTGALQEADALAVPTVWKNVTPAPAGNSYTTSAASAARKYYRTSR